MMLWLMVLLFSPQDVDRLLSAGKTDRALAVLKENLSRLDQVQGRLVLQSFLAHEAYDAFWEVLTLLRQRFSCPTCYADLGWAAAVRTRDRERALEETLTRIQGVRNPRLVKAFWEQFARTFRTSWTEVRPSVESWAARRRTPEAWKVLMRLARDMDPPRAVRYALRAGDRKAAREILLELPPAESLFLILPSGLERDLVGLRLGRMEPEDFFRKYGGKLRPEDWAFVLQYLPPDPVWSGELARIARTLGLPEGLMHEVVAGELTPARVDTLCGEKVLPEGMTRACGMAYLRMGKPNRALMHLRRVVMARAGEEDALLWLWALEATMGNREGVEHLMALLDHPEGMECEDAVCTLLQAILLTRSNPEASRKALEDLVLSEAPEPLKDLARHYLEYGPPSAETFRLLRDFLRGLSAGSVMPHEKIYRNRN